MNKKRVTAYIKNKKGEVRQSKLFTLNMFPNNKTNYGK